GTARGVPAGTGLPAGTITDTGTIAIAAGGVGTTQIASGSVGSQQIDTDQVQVRVSGGCANGHYISAVGANGSVTCQTDDVGTPAGSAWNLAGNANSSGSFVGTTDANPLLLKINNLQAARFTPSGDGGHAASVNVALGAASNTIGGGAYGNTIGGGEGNFTGGGDATVGGGNAN